MLSLKIQNSQIYNFETNFVSKSELFRPINLLQILILKNYYSQRTNFHKCNEIQNIYGPCNKKQKLMKPV